MVLVMRVNRTYSIDYDTIKDLNSTISAKHRSKFVDKAIKNRLEGKKTLEIDEIDTIDLLRELAYRGELGRDRRQLVQEWFRELRQ